MNDGMGNSVHQSLLDKSPPSVMRLEPNSLHISDHQTPSPPARPCCSTYRNGTTNVVSKIYTIHTLGASTYDVRSGWVGGPQKADERIKIS